MCVFFSIKSTGYLSFCLSSSNFQLPHEGKINLFELNWIDLSLLLSVCVYLPISFPFSFSYVFFFRGVFPFLSFFSVSLLMDIFSDCLVSNPFLSLNHFRPKVALLLLKEIRKCFCWASLVGLYGRKKPLDTPLIWSPLPSQPSF